MIFWRDRPWEQATGLMFRRPTDFMTGEPLNLERGVMRRRVKGQWQYRQMTEAEAEVYLAFDDSYYV